MKLEYCFARAQSYDAMVRNRTQDRIEPIPTALLWES
jgi:hypothetical protein